MDINELILKAKNASKNSYSPYSLFKVGVAIETSDGNVILGTNIENSSYGLTMCAERVAIFNAITAGYNANNILKLCVYADSDNIPTPCGACRQVMIELLDKSTEIICANKKFEYKIYNVESLLPLAFTKENLND